MRRLATQLILAIALIAFGLGISLEARAQRRILILGASISWGCVGNCLPDQTEAGYVDRLRELLPDSEIRVQAWFSSGVADWDPEALPIEAQQLTFPVGVWQAGEGQHVNLWHLMARPQLCSWRPDYVVVMAGLGDVLRALRGPPWAWTSQSAYRSGVRRLAEAIERAGAVPVLTVDSPFAAGSPEHLEPILEGYAASIAAVCDERRLRCGPDLRAVVDRRRAFVGTDRVHPNALGHQQIAEAFAEWFDAEPRHHRRRGKRGCR